MDKDDLGTSIEDATILILWIGTNRLIRIANEYHQNERELDIGKGIFAIKIDKHGPQTTRLWNRQTIFARIIGINLVDDDSKLKLC